MLKKLSIVLTTAATVLGAGTILTSTAQAAPTGLAGHLSGAADTLNMIEKTQFIYLGHNYCWYDDGWNGPGWYWCGYRWRRGFGWGGGHGWRGHWPRRLRRRLSRRSRRRLHGGGGGGGMHGRWRRRRRRWRRRHGWWRRRHGRRRRRHGRRRRRHGRWRRRHGWRRRWRRWRRWRRQGAMSDIRAKHDIVLLGHLDNGLGFYRFSYNGSDKAYVGVMAQEVQTVMPDAVVQRQRRLSARLLRSARAAHADLGRLDRLGREDSGNHDVAPTVKRGRR